MHTGRNKPNNVTTLCTHQWALPHLKSWLTCFNSSPALKFCRYNRSSPCVVSWSHFPPIFPEGLMVIIAMLALLFFATYVCILYTQIWYVYKRLLHIFFQTYEIGIMPNTSFWNFFSFLGIMFLQLLPCWCMHPWCNHFNRCIVLPWASILQVFICFSGSGLQAAPLPNHLKKVSPPITNSAAINTFWLYQFLYKHVGVFFGHVPRIGNAES